MNKISLILLPSALLLFLTSCNKEEVDDTEDIIGNWKLIEMLADPGDGSGVYEAVISERQISFLADDTIECIGDLCDFSYFSSGDNTAGEYSITTNKITELSCDGDLELSFQYSGDTLVLTYPCIEPCLAKYVRI